MEISNETTYHIVGGINPYDKIELYSEGKIKG